MTQFKYLILDAARMNENVEAAKKFDTSYRSIYETPREKIFQKIGPYLFLLNGKKQFINWYFEHGWLDYWGAILVSDLAIDSLKCHFLKFKYALDEKGKKQYFRYYDPRVLTEFLPTCTEEELSHFFGPVQCFIVAGHTFSEVICYTNERGILAIRKISMEELNYLVASS